MGWSRYRRRHRFKDYYGFAPYVTVAEHKAEAQKKIAQLVKKGVAIRPIVIENRTIVQTFWGQAWCKHLEKFSDYENRLPRGRSYVRNGSVIDLQIKSGEITAMVNGSSLYDVNISIKPYPQTQWQAIVKECVGKINSLVELLQGKFSKNVMEIITHADQGLFPQPKEIKFNCSCPDYAELCKHIAAVLYGIGSRLDENPEELFLLRQKNHLELISQASSGALTTTETTAKVLSDDHLSQLFGIEIQGDGATDSSFASVADTSKIKKSKLKSKIKTKVKIKNAIKDDKEDKKILKNENMKRKSKTQKKLKPLSSIRNTQKNKPENKKSKKRKAGMGKIKLKPIRLVAKNQKK